MKLPPLVKILPTVLAIFLTGYATIYQCFTQRQIYFDEVGLYNPVYTYLHYGKMTYPVHGEFDSMFVHPPTQYFLVATLMRFGLSVYHAGGLLSVLLFAIFAALVVSSRFEFPVQIAFLLGTFLGAFIWNEALILRPDLTLTLSWIAGLVALETARLDNWNRFRLAAGGLLLALATGVHYIGVAACLGFVVYGVWIWKSLGWKYARGPFAWMLGGASIYAVPDLTIFVIPHIKDIIAFSLAVQADAPPGSAFARQMEAYAAWKSVLPYWFPLRPITTLLTEPLFRWSIPAAFVGPPLLFLLPATRGLALAAIPHLFFILFGARHKQIGYTGYFAPEITIYLIAVLSLGLTAVFAGLQRLKKAAPVAIAAIAIVTSAGWLAATEVPALVTSKVVLTPGLYDFDAARAAGLSMLGSGAVVGTDSAGVWYTSGAAHLYTITPDIIYPDDIHCIDLRKYFSFFDALAADPHQSWVAYNKERENVTSSYADGLLQLRGFFFADRRDRFESGESYMLYSVDRPKLLMGYGMKGEEVERFEESSDGDQRFVSAVCPTSYGERNGPLDNTDLKLDFYGAWYRPIASNGDPRGAKDLSLPASIISFISDKDRFEKTLQPALRGCTVRDEVRGRLTRIPLRQFIQDAHEKDETIRFYRGFDDFRSVVGNLPGRSALHEATGLPTECDASSAQLGPTNPAGDTLTTRPPEFTFSMPGALRLDSIALAYDKASIEGKSPVLVRTAPQQWAYAASIPIILDRSPGSKRLIHIRGEVIQGDIGLGILNRKTNAFEVEKFIYPSSEAMDFYFPIPAPDKADDLIIRNAAPAGTVSEMKIFATEILAPAHRIDPSVSLTQASLADPKASITPGKTLSVTTAAEQWAYAAVLPVHSGTFSKGVILKIRARILEGEIGFGLLSRNEKSFVVEQRYAKSSDPVDVLLPLADARGVSKLIIRNTAPNGIESMAVVESIETWKLD